jgi:isocitrate dehydrogenase (NAD+)
MASRHRVTLIPGDGIGPEVSAAARLVLDAAVSGIEWIERDAGSAALAEHGELLPEETLEAIRETRVAIKGPITTPVGSGFRSINVALRQELDLFAAVRPARSLSGVPTRHSAVDLVVIRENTEDLYQGVEFAAGSPQAAALREELRRLADFEIRPDAGVTVKPISVAGTRRIVRFAFEYSKANRRRTITLGPALMGGFPFVLSPPPPPPHDHLGPQGGDHADVGRVVPSDREGRRDRSR